jgi:hypothetical protein
MYLGNFVFFLTDKILSFFPRKILFDGSSGPNPTRTFMGSLKSNYKEKGKNSRGIISFRAVFVLQTKRFFI